MDHLYYSPGAASLLVHWLLIELDLPHELHLVDTAAGAQKSPGYLALNPNGVVPTLVRDGRPMSEAAAIAMTLGDSHPRAKLAPAPGDALRPQYNQWMFHLANAVQPLLRLWWYPHEAAGAEHADAARASVGPRIGSAWDRIDAYLGARDAVADQPYLLGASPCVADFYLTMLMRWSRAMPRPATDWTHLSALAALMRARPSFVALHGREGLTEWT